MPPLTDEEKEDLSPEELAAIEDGGDDPEDKGSDDDQADPPEDPPADPPPEKKADDPPADDPPEDAPPEDPPKDEPDETVAIVPGIKLQLIPDDEIKRLEDAVTDLKAKFDDGEVAFTELSAAENALNKAQLKNEMAAEVNTASAQAGWKAEQERFYRNNPAFSENEYLQTALVNTVNKMIAAKEGDGMSDEAFLKEAQSRVIAGLEKAGFKIPSDDTPAKTDADKQKEAAAALAAAKKKGADRSGIPKDLKDVPAAESPGADNEFAYLDKLAESDGEAFEKAVGKLSAEQLQRYEDSH